MTIVKGNFGGDGGPPTLDNVDLSNAKTLECDSCGCKAFKQTLMLRKLSALISPTGQEAIVPVGVFACEACGHINKEFIEADIKQS